MLNSLKFRFQSWRSRFLFDYEWDMKWAVDYTELAVFFYVPRKPTFIRFLFPNSDDIGVMGVKAVTGGEERPVLRVLQNQALGAGVELVRLESPAPRNMGPRDTC